MISPFEEPDEAGSVVEFDADVKRLVGL